MFTSFQERLKAAAEAGAATFDSAGHALQQRVSAAHLPTEGGALPKLPGLGGSQADGSAKDGSPGKPASPLASPGVAGERRSGEITRNSALANRLSSLVAGSGSPTSKTGAGRSTSLSGTPRQSSDVAPTSPLSERSSVPPPSNVSDPASIPLPSSAPSSPSLRPSTPNPNSLLETPGKPAFIITDSNPASGAASPQMASTTLFNTPRNPSATAPQKSPETPKNAVPDVIVSLGTPEDKEVPAATEEAATEPDEVEKAAAEQPPSADPPAPAPPSKDTSSLPSPTHITVPPPAPVTASPALDIPPPTIPSDPAELTAAYTTLATQAAKVNAILAKTSPLLGAGIEDTDALEGWLSMMGGKVEMGAAELKRLNDKLQLQDSRIEEIRDTHKLESASSTGMITQLRDQLAQQEKNLSTQAGQTIQLAGLRSDLTKSQSQAKDAEEKASKAINLLKTVRSKLVKVEKERDEMEKGQTEEKNERGKMVESLEKLRAEREKEVINLRQGFEKEVAGVKERFERDLAAKKGQWELEMITTKATHAKDLAAKSTRITTLQATIKELTAEKQAQFDTLQQRQEEIEAANAAKESYESRMKELEFQLREALERASLAEDTVADLRRDHFQSPPLESTHLPESDAVPTQDIPRLLADASKKSEAKLAEYRLQLSRLERERLESEEEHSRQLRDRASELDRLRAVLQQKEEEYGEAVKGQARYQDKIDKAEKDKAGLRAEMAEMEALIKELKESQLNRGDVEEAIREEMDGVRQQLEAVNGQLEEARNTAAQLRSNNRTLREEMRRIQSSAQLLERQRNPGVGYWAAGSGGTAAPPSAATPPLTSRSGNATPGGSDAPTPGSGPLGRRSTDGVMSPTKANGGGRSASPAPSEAPSKANEEEEVNLEYLRNVILQFLENKEMRPNLVRVLSVILRFTPQELRRLNSKLTA